MYGFGRLRFNYKIEFVHTTSVKVCSSLSLKWESNRSIQACLGRFSVAVLKLQTIRQQ